MSGSRSASESDARDFLQSKPGFNSREIAEQNGRTHVVCMGDSHIRIFHHITQWQLVPWAWFDVRTVRGASAQGIVKQFSASGALTIFHRRLDVAEHWQHLVFLLGEVDCGWLVWVRAQRDGVSVDSQIETSLRNYAAFLREVVGRGFENVWVLSVPLPTILDDQNWGEVGHARRSVRATQRERTELTLSYNERLAEICASGPASFIDVTSAQLDPGTGLVASSFRNLDRANHHLKPEAYAGLVAEKLGPALKPRG